MAYDDKTMRLNRFGLPPGFVLPVVIFGSVMGVILGFAEPPMWVYYVATLPYWPFFVYQMRKRIREEAPPSLSATRRRRPGRRLG